MLLIKNAKIYSMVAPIIEQGDILIENNKIVKIGQGIEEKKAEVLRADGLIALPGLVDAHTHIGGMNFSQPTHTDDLNEMTNNITPDLQAIYGIDPGSPDFAYAYQNGITTVAITPGSGNVVAGWAFAAKTYGKNIFEMCIKNPIALKVALGGNPKRVYGKRNQQPSTRMSIPVMIKDLLSRANEYLEKKEQAQRENEELPAYDRELEAVIPVLKKEIPLKIHCTQFDMLTAIEIAREFGLDFTLDHAWGASEYLEEIIESGCKIVFGPIGSMKSLGEARLIDIESVVELDRRGVPVSLITDAPILSIDSLLHHAGEAVRAGCAVERVLRMITINAAEIIGVADRVGSLEVGKDADIVLFKGLPAYDTKAEVIATLINGKIVYSPNFFN